MEILRPLFSDTEMTPQFNSNLSAKSDYSCSITPKLPQAGIQIQTYSLTPPVSSYDTICKGQK